MVLFYLVIVVTCLHMQLGGWVEGPVVAIIGNVLKCLSQSIIFSHDEFSVDRASGKQLSLFGLRFTDGRYVFGKTGFHFNLKTSSNSFNCGGMY
ncbi:hypothetical protein AMTRI_Chr07g27500 [Amborella trichopoda]